MEGLSNVSFTNLQCRELCCFFFTKLGFFCSCLPTDKYNMMFLNRQKTLFSGILLWYQRNKNTSGYAVVENSEKQTKKKKVRKK